jgi:hypothetical protein
MAKDWFEFIKQVQDIARAVPKTDQPNDTFFEACKERLCALSLKINDNGYMLIDQDVANHIIKQYQDKK